MRKRKKDQPEPCDCPNCTAYRLHLAQECERKVEARAEFKGVPVPVLPRAEWITYTLQ